MAKNSAKSIKALGNHIDKLRLEKKYSIRKFPSMCEISKSQVNELGNKGVDFRYSTIIKIAKGLDMPVSELLDF
jgi:transcriptional regulator with XRE-family HTH domain